MPMAAIIIDGYNLIGTAHRDLARQRDALVERLAAYRKLRGHELTVVFDGWKSGGGQESAANVGGVKVIYSRLGDTADTVIKRIISSGGREWIVVSSDRAISSHAWAVGSVPVPSDAFLQAVHHTLEGPPDENPQGEGEESELPGGAGRTLSRKDRALQRALRKL